MEKLEMFLKELTELTNKYGIAIGGCGCCGSPWVYDTTSDDGFLIDNLEYDESKKKYVLGDNKF